MAMSQNGVTYWSVLEVITVTATNAHYYCNFSIFQYVFNRLVFHTPWWQCIAETCMEGQKLRSVCKCWFCK